MNRLLAGLLFCFAMVHCGFAAEPALRVGVFAVDASPAVGSPLAYDPTKEVTWPLSCKGVVLLGKGDPVVLCAVDWIGIANDSNKEFRKALADAVGTRIERVCVHTLHQHDAPACDFSTDRLLAERGIGKEVFDSPFAHKVIARASAAAREAAAAARPVTHLGLGEATIEKVASTRRILGPDGKVKYVRYSSCQDPVIRDQPVGTIDPLLKMISFWDGEKPIVALTYYATHPQSYYRTGGANPDFPGMARDAREKATGTPHIHFDGAGGNVAAGKWNDGSHKNRQILADRVADGMARAWKATTRTPIGPDDVDWKSVPVVLPAASYINESALKTILDNASATVGDRAEAARELVWLRRCRAGDPIDVGCLRLGRARILHLPGELFVEYQLAAQKLRPDLFVALAAYGDYGPGYIGTEIAYSQGGYETAPKISLVAPGVERVLMDAIKTLLKD